MTSPELIMWARGFSGVASALLAIGLICAVVRNHLSHRSVRWLLLTLAALLVFTGMEQFGRLVARAQADSGIVMDMNTWPWVVMAVGKSASLVAMVFVWATVPPKALESPKAKKQEG
jgi:hypothetical protein